MQNQLRILIVEDEPEISGLIREVLGADGLFGKSSPKFKECRDGYEALEAIRSNRFDLIISDINMPKLSGDEFIFACQSKKSLNKETPVIVVTANPKGTSLSDIRYENIYVIEKPFRGAELQNVAKMYVAKLSASKVKAA